MIAGVSLRLPYPNFACLVSYELVGFQNVAHVCDQR
jgi:hypothetical protein